MPSKTAPCISRTLNTLQEARRVNRKLFKRFTQSIPFVSASDPDSEIFGLPDTWDTLSTLERTEWARLNWSRLIQDI